MHTRKINERNFANFKRMSTRKAAGPKRKLIKNKTHTPQLQALMNGPCLWLWFHMGYYTTISTSFWCQGHTTLPWTAGRPHNHSPQQSLTMVGQHFSIIHMLRCLRFYDGTREDNVSKSVLLFRCTALEKQQTIPQDQTGSFHFIQVKKNVEQSEIINTKFKCLKNQKSFSR